MNILPNIPNIISIIRILMVFPIVLLIWNKVYDTAFILMIIAGLSDGLDGFLARAFHWQSKLGAMLDPAADKLLLVSIFIVCGLKGFLPWWLVSLVILRDVIIVTGTFLYQRVTQDKDIRPLFISKVNTALQITLAVAALYQEATASLPEYLILILIWVVAATTLASGIAYVTIWTRNTLEHKKNN